MTLTTQKDIRAKYDYHKTMLVASNEHNLKILDHGTQKMIDASIYHGNCMKQLEEVML